MNIDQLIESLSQNAPDPGQVLASVGRKRRAARNRMYTVSGALAVVIVVVLGGVLLSRAGLGGATSSSSAPAGGIAAPAAAPQSGFAGTRSQPGDASSAARCGTVRLQAQLAEAVHKGASVIVGYGTLSDGTTSAPGQTSYSSVTLRSVQTLAGPTVASGAIAWIAGAGQSASASSGPASPAAQSPAFASGGELFGIVSPSATSGAPGPVLQAAPVDNGQVLLSGPGCWDITGFSSLHSPASSSESPQSALSGANVITTIPLATAEKLATQPG